MTAAADGRYWVRLQRSDGIDEILHLSPDDQLLARSRLAEQQNAYGPRRGNSLNLQALPDGQLLGYRSNFFNGVTELTRFAANGSVDWSMTDVPLRSYCPRVEGTTSGGIWMLCEFSEGRYQLFRIDAAGRPRSVLGPSELDEGALRSSLAVAADGSVFVGGVDTDDLPTVWHFDERGEELWQRSLGLPVTQSLRQVALDPNGDVTVATRLDSAVLELRTLAANDGALISAHELDLGTDFNGLELLQSANNGDWLLLLNGLGSDTLVRASDQGERLWLTTLPAGRTVVQDRPHPHALLEAGGELRLMAEFDDPQSFKRSFELLVLDTLGQLVRQVLIGTQDDFDDAVPLPQQGGFLTSGRLGRIDGEGQFHPIDLSASLVGQEQPLLLATYSEADEQIIVVESNSGRWLQSWQRDGQLRWQQALQRGVLQDEFSDLKDLQVNAHSVCWQITEAGGFPPTELPVTCFDRANGSAQLSFDPSPEFDSRAEHRLLAGDELARIVRNGDSAVLRFSALPDGAETRAAVPLESTQAQLLSQPGAAGVAVRDGSDLRVYWTDGQLPDSLTLPYLFEPVTLLPQGLFHGLQWFPRDGGEPVLLDDPFRSGFGMQVAAGERIHLVSQTDFGTIKLWGLDTVTSALIWTTELRGNSSLVWAYPAANDDQVLLIGSNAADLDLRWVNRGDGSLISTRSVECGAPQCRFELSGQPSGPAGLDLLELRIQDDTTSALRAVHQSTVPAATRADQAGVAGLWFHPGLAGQGLVLSYVPESRTLFAPWFNYVPYGRTHDQSTLRWYSLQGNAELAANAVELQLLRNAGGRFGEPPATQAEVVGSARIQFESCDRATLHYDFGDAEEGAGSQPLIRLGPSNRSCVLADGTVQAPALVAADREGFSSRQSGAWFDPLSAGQGLMFEVVPASTSQAGLLFAAWFSYDREGEGDDEFAHDWFILQGDLSQASSGRLVVPIYRSIGGAFDRRQTSNLFRVGEAELQFDDCNSLQLSYRFDDSELAQSHAGLQGQQSLQRIGGCTAAGAN